MGAKASNRDVAPAIRGAFKRACLMLDDERKGDKGQGLSELILESLKDDVKGTLQAIKGFVPKELDVDVTATELSHEQWLAKLEGADGSGSDSTPQTTTE